MASRGRGLMSMEPLPQKKADPRFAEDAGAGLGVGGNASAQADYAEASAVAATAEDAQVGLVAVESVLADPSAYVAPAEIAGVAGTGRSLILAELSPPDVTLIERILRFGFRIGIPAATLVAPFSKPAKPRLQATVESPLAGDRAAGMALRAGHFLVMGAKTPIAQVDMRPTANLAPPFERVVHSFSWLRDLGACEARMQCAPTAERVLAAWLEANPKPGKGPAWNAGLAARRAMAWMVHAPLILSGQDKRLRRRTMAALAETIRWLDRNPGKAQDPLESVAVWCAITAGGLLLPQGKPRRLFGEAGLSHALGELIGDDGGVLSRSPLDQMDALELLVDMGACYRAVRRDPPDVIGAMIDALVPPLLALCHGDGGLGSWQGAGAVEAERVNALVAATGVRTRPLRDARQWGYQRVTEGKAVLQFDAAPPPLGRYARHGCASTLAFELSHGTQRIITNCGGAAFAGGQVPMRIELGLRATAAHSTLALGDVNSTAVMINGRLGNGVNEVEVDRRSVVAEGGGNATRLEASHDGYVSRFGLVHRRILILREDGTELRGADNLVPSGKKVRTAQVPYALRFHLGPGVEALRLDSGRGAGLALADGSYWQFVAAEHDVVVDESIWVDGAGRPHPVQQLVMQGHAPPDGSRFSWLLRKIG